MNVAFGILSVVVYLVTVVYVLLLLARVDRIKGDRDVLKTALERANAIAADQAHRMVAEAEVSDALAACVHAYIRQMDEYSTKLNEPQLALKREREALARHTAIKSQPLCHSKN